MTQPDIARTEPPKRKRLSSEARRQDFINQAIEFFAEEGFESSTRGLAKRLGVTQPLLYRYFPSKNDLISEVYDAVYVKRWQPEWEPLLRDRSRPLADRLNTFYNVYTDAIFNRRMDADIPVLRPQGRRHQSPLHATGASAHSGTHPY